MQRGLILALSMVAICEAFVVNVPGSKLTRSLTSRQLSNENDPTSNLFAQFADSLQNALTNSPLNEGKKKLVRMLAGDYNKDEIQEKIGNFIEENPVLMLSFTTCPFCLKAKSVLDEKGVTYKAVELDQEPDGGAMRAEMANLIGRTSVPAIWIGGSFVGGCNDGPMGGIVKLNDSGELDSILKGVGAL